MTKDFITNLPASIHQRLLNLDPARTHDFTPVLRRYAFERWLYRLGKSDHAESFVVKGAMLFVLWTGDCPARRWISIFGNRRLYGSTASGERSRKSAVRKWSRTD